MVSMIFWGLNNKALVVIIIYFDSNTDTFEVFRLHFNKMVDLGVNPTV